MKTPIGRKSCVIVLLSTRYIFIHVLHVFKGADKDNGLENPWKIQKRIKIKCSQFVGE
jgi:hypothetical protein